MNANLIESHQLLEKELEHANKRYREALNNVNTGTDGKVFQGKFTLEQYISVLDNIKIALTLVSNIEEIEHGRKRPEDSRNATANKPRTSTAGKGKGKGGRAKSDPHIEQTTNAWTTAVERQGNGA